MNHSGEAHPDPALPLAATSPGARHGRPARFRTHLLRLVLATSLPLLALGIGLAWWIAATERNAALLDLARTAEALQSELDRELSITATALEVLATSPALDAALAAGGDGTAFWEQARGLVGRRPAALDNIILLGADRQGVLNTLVPPGTPLPPVGQLRSPRPMPQPLDPMAVLAEILRGRQVYVSPLFLGPLAGRPVVTVVIPVRRAERAVGLLAANILPASLGAVLRGQRLKPGWVATLVDGMHLVIARTRDGERLLAQPAPPWLADFQRSGVAAATVRGTNLDGTESYAALRHLPQGDWTIALSVSRAALDGPLRRAIAIAAAGGLLAVALATLLATTLGARLGHEMEALSADAARMAREEPPPQRPAPKMREVALVRDALTRAGGALRARAAAKREAEEHLVLLLREVDHRAKNALAVALSLVRLAPRDVSPAEFAATVEGRITAMARAHALLARGAWTGAELHALAEGELLAHAGQVRLDGPATWLAAEAVQPVAMLLHELATNAAKHGALSVPDGAVRVAWDIAPGDGSLHLAWEERGGPPVVGAPGRRSFGLRLMTQLAERQLAGRLGFDWAPDGLRVTLVLPAGRAIPEGMPPGPGDEPGDEPADEPADRAAPADGPGPGAGTTAAWPVAMPPRRGWTGSGGPPPRILVVEDEALLALELETGLRELGCEVIGPARNLAEACRLAQAEPRLACAVLDVNLGNGELVFPVADALAARGIPYLLATGYGSAGPLEGRDAGAAAVLHKPYNRTALAAGLARALATPVASKRGSG